MLITALLGAAFFAGCQDMGPTAADAEPQFAKGGGGNPDPIPVTITLAGGMTATAQDGRLKADDSRGLELVGANNASGDCVDPLAEGCFESALNLSNDLADINSCVVPKHRGTTMSPGDQALLLGLLDDDTQARWSFNAEVDRRKGTGFIRTMWYETNDPDSDRYVYFVRSDNPDETVDGEVTFNGGVVAMYGTGFTAFECNWTGTITLSYEPA